jgi:hypothetical protein
MDNREWLKSLSPRALAEEIHYGRMLAESSRHREHAAQGLREAIEERERRKGEGNG